MKTPELLMSLNSCSEILEEAQHHHPELFCALHFCANFIVFLPPWSLCGLDSLNSCNGYRGGLDSFTSLYCSFGISSITLPPVRCNLFHLAVSCLSRTKFNIFLDRCKKTPLQRPGTAKPGEFSSHEEVEQLVNSSMELYYRSTVRSA